MFKEDQEVFVTLLDSAHGIIDADGERGVISYAGRVNEGQQLVYVLWVDRPLRHQRNGAIRPFSQMWLTR